jgi:hypothetical protein
MMSRPAMHQLGPPTEYVGVCWNDVVRLRNAVQPSLDLVRLLDILPTRDLHAGLDLSNGRSR